LKRQANKDKQQDRWRNKALRLQHLSPRHPCRRRRMHYGRTIPNNRRDARPSVQSWRWILDSRQRAFPLQCRLRRVWSRRFNVWIMKRADRRQTDPLASLVDAGNCCRAGGRQLQPTWVAI